MRIMQDNNGNINRGTINKITTCPNRNWTHPQLHPPSHSINNPPSWIDKNRRSSLTCSSSLTHRTMMRTIYWVEVGGRLSLSLQFEEEEVEGNERSEVESSKEYFKLDLCVPFITLHIIARHQQHSPTQ